MHCTAAANLWAQSFSALHTGVSQMFIRRLAAFVLPILLSVLAACSYSIESPVPSLSSAEPSLVCTEQLVTTVVLSGDGMSPLPINSFTDDPGLQLPDLALHRVAELDGSAPADTPTVDLDEGEAGGHVRWQSQQKMDFDIFEELLVPPGNYDVSATNADGQKANLAGGLTAVPPPRLDAVDPQLICSEQIDNIMTLTGEGFLTVEGVLPLINFGVLQLSADSVDGCFDVVGPTTAQSCTEITVTIPADSLAPDIYDVFITNPAPADCISTEPMQIEVVPPPSLDTIVPDLVCTEQFENGFTLSGSSFLVLEDGTLPTIRIGGYSAPAAAATNCVDLLGPAGGELCTNMGILMPIAAVDVGIHDVVVTNPAPANCVSEELVEIEVIPPPSLQSVDPEIVCTEQSSNLLTLTGVNFLRLADGTLPNLMVGTYSSEADSAAGTCTALMGPAGGELCTELTLTLPQGAITEGVHDVMVTNPFAADCASTEVVQIEVVAPPSLVSATPELSCNEQSDTLYTLTGTGFLEINGTLPMVIIGSYVAPADAIAGSCQALTGPVPGQVCTQVSLTVPMGSLTGGLHDISLINPGPADCSTIELVQVDTVPAPEVVSLNPGTTCVGSPIADTTINGNDFLVLFDGTEPTVTIGGQSVPVQSHAGCTPLGGPQGGELCTQLTVGVPGGIFGSINNYPVEMTNPSPAGCSSNTDVSFSVSPAPSVDGVLPLQFCEQVPETLTVSGANFNQGSGVLIDGSAALVLAVRFINSTTLEVDIASSLTPGFHDLSVSNGPACAFELIAAFEVVANPIVFFVDPPVIYSQITTQMTFFVSQVPSGIVDVAIEEVATGVVTPLTVWSYDGANSISAEVEAGLLGLAEGDYRVHVESGLGCPGVLDTAFYIENDLTVAIDFIDPPFGWEQADTPVDINAVPTGQLQPGEVQFQDLPRVYLNPSSGTAATNLGSVSFQAPELLNAVVPSGLPADIYDVIIVNPDGSIGVLFDSFEVTVLPPPIINSVSPNRSDASNPTPAVINGANFRNPTVDLTCLEPNGSITTDVANVTGSNATSINATIPSDALPSGTVCVVRVVNDDGTFFDFSAISVGSPSGNLFDWSAGLPMVEARRAPASVAGRATERARYLYSIGGDDGAVASAKTSIEVAPLDAFGIMRPWRLLPNSLPEARTMSGVARLGRYIYLVGGNDGLGPVDTVLRAQILDPLASPEFANLSIQFGNGNGLDGGTWSYRIAAVFGPADLINPSGESLSSDPIVVRLPAVPDKIHLNLSWTAVPDAVAYHVYRSPLPDSPSGSEELLTTVGGTSHLDTGGATTPGLVPLPNGALGNWADVATLPGANMLDAARSAPGVGFGEDPSSPGIHYLYVGGGLDGNGVARDTINYLMVDTTGGDQIVGSFATSTATLATGRAELGLFVVDSSLHSVVGPTETWLYFGPGKDTGGGYNRDTDAAQVIAGGDLLWTGNQGSFTPGRSGYTSLSANNFLYVMGGERQAGAASNDGKETSIDGPPLLGGWNSLGGSTLTVARAFPGSAIESAVVFSIGGSDAAGNALNSTDFTNF